MVLQRLCVAHSPSRSLFDHKPNMLVRDRVMFPAGKAVCIPRGAPRLQVRTPPRHFICSFLIPEYAADPAPASQQPDARTSISCKELRRQRTASPPASSFSLPVVECALAEIEGSDTCAAPGSIGVGKRVEAPMSPVLGSGEPWCGGW